jgi:hypothetical protein
MVEKKEMPLESYYMGHQDAKLTDEQRLILFSISKKPKKILKEGSCLINKNHGKLGKQTYCIF